MICWAWCADPGDDCEWLFLTVEYMSRALSMSCSVLSFDLALEMVMGDDEVRSAAAAATAVDRWRMRRRRVEDDDVIAMVF